MKLRLKKWHGQKKELNGKKTYRRIVAEITAIIDIAPGFVVENRSDYEVIMQYDKSQLHLNIASECYLCNWESHCSGVLHIARLSGILTYYIGLNHLVPFVGVDSIVSKGETTFSTTGEVSVSTRLGGSFDPMELAKIEYESHKRLEFICLDDGTEIKRHGEGKDFFAALMYLNAHKQLKVSYVIEAVLPYPAKLQSQ